MKARKMIAVAILVVACGNPVKDEEHESAVADGDDREQRDELFKATESSTTSSYRTCQHIDGTPCSNPGSVFRCYYQYPNEPGICVCLSNFTWSCG
jgi:hypothetical protein